MKRSVLLLALLIAGAGFCLTGCTPKPKVASQDLSIPTAGTFPAGEFPAQKPRFGQFNLQKRHGLGAWEGATPAVSEREWVRKLSSSTQRFAHLTRPVKQ